MAKHPAAVALGKLGGSVTSPAKAAASRANGKKGGRPKRDQLATVIDAWLAPKAKTVARGHGTG